MSNLVQTLVRDRNLRLAEKLLAQADREIAERDATITALREEVERLKDNQWPFGKRPNPVVGHTFGDFAVYGDEKSVKRVQAAMHEHDAMMPERIKRINEQAAELTALREEVEEARKERDEAVNWASICDRHGLDGFDALADHWLAMEPIQRMHNAATSVFSKWSNDELMGRFKRHLDGLMHTSFVEGCIVGVRAELVKTKEVESELTALRQRVVAVLGAEVFDELAADALFDDCNRALVNPRGL